jgi:hypothetical protein
MPHHRWTAADLPDPHHHRQALNDGIGSIRRALVAGVTVVRLVVLTVPLVVGPGTVGAHRVDIVLGVQGRPVALWGVRGVFVHAVGYPVRAASVVSRTAGVGAG